MKAVVFELSVSVVLTASRCPSFLTFHVNTLNGSAGVSALPYQNYNMVISSKERKETFHITPSKNYIPALIGNIIVIENVLI